jgi:hypothetical protein
VAALPDGGHVVAGATEPVAGTPWGHWALRLDADGHMVWQRELGYGGWDVSVAANSEGDIYLAWPSATSGDDARLIVVRMDDRGAAIWARTLRYAEGSPHWAPQLAVLPDGTVATVEGALVVAFDAGGDVLWQRRLAYESAHGFRLLGAAPTGDDAAPLVVAGPYYLGTWFAAFAPDGELRWQRDVQLGIYGGTLGVLAARDGGIFGAGGNSDTGGGWIVHLPRGGGLPGTCAALLEGGAESYSASATLEPFALTPVEADFEVVEGPPPEEVPADIPVTVLCTDPAD